MISASYTLVEVNSLSMVRWSGPASFRNWIRSGGISGIFSLLVVVLVGLVWFCPRVGEYSPPVYSEVVVVEEVVVVCFH